MSRRRKASLPADVQAVIEHVDDDGLATGQAGAGLVSCRGALPGERVQLRAVNRRAGVFECHLKAVLAPAPGRIEPACDAFGRCGGCSWMQLPPAAQALHKQQRVQQLLAAAGVDVEGWSPPLRGPSSGYRWRARLGVRCLRATAGGDGAVLVGFREHGTRHIPDANPCPNLAGPLRRIAAELPQAITRLGARQSIPQVELVGGDGIVAMIVRHLVDLDDADRATLAAFTRRHRVRVLLQRHGPDALEVLAEPDSEALRYALPDWGLELLFEPLDFIQVNPAVNRAMVRQALQWLAPRPTDRVLDLFCGIGNFTLPLARLAGAVHGVEGGEGLVERARGNAARNGITNATFACADLHAPDVSIDAAVDGIVLDPPRSGAGAALPAIAAAPARAIVYVSCDPRSLARDLQALCAAGWRVRRAGIMDMFVHTTHVETMVLLQRPA